MEDNYPATETFSPIAQAPSAQDLELRATHDRLRELEQAHASLTVLQAKTAMQLQAFQEALQPLITAVIESKAFSTTIDSALEQYTKSEAFTEMVANTVDSYIDIEKMVEEEVESAIGNLDFSVEVNQYGRSRR